jgi:alginate O-acetyltransferase complex protein AlgI
MLFNSIEFAFFFPLVALSYFLLPQSWRTPALLVASCIFYMAFIPAYILILIITILIDYTAGIYLERTRGRKRTMLLVMSIVATCSVLFVFKYYEFFQSNFVGLAAFFGWNFRIPYLKVILPIGLSFHTFQSLSYVIEVYRHRQPVERHFITYATYVMFFPQLVAGPIERPQNLLHQFYERHPFDYERIASGLRRMALGFFKKLVIADRLALYVNDVFAAPQKFNGLQLSLATVFFAYQIYCDFSGYSDIAIGSARVLGFKLMENFDTPYHARSIGEFWHRWHISLSTWFRDYLYVPLGGSRVAVPRWCMNILITFAVSGLWHGANWTFVAWGLLNGVYLLTGVVTKSFRDAAVARIGLLPEGVMRKLIQIPVTFLLVCVGWVFFRSRNLDDAFYVLTHFWTDWNFGAIGTEQFLLRQLPVAVGAIVLLEFGQLLQASGRIRGGVVHWPVFHRWPVYVSFALGVVMFGIYRQTQFIYFQF